MARSDDAPGEIRLHWDYEQRTWREILNNKLVLYCIISALSGYRICTYRTVVLSFGSCSSIDAVLYGRYDSRQWSPNDSPRSPQQSSSGDDGQPRKQNGDLPPVCRQNSEVDVDSRSVLALRWLIILQLRLSTSTWYQYWRAALQGTRADYCRIRLHLRCDHTVM